MWGQSNKIDMAFPLECLDIAGNPNSISSLLAFSSWTRLHWNAFAMQNAGSLAQVSDPPIDCSDLAKASTYSEAHSNSSDYLGRFKPQLPAIGSTSRCLGAHLARHPRISFQKQQKRRCLVAFSHSTAPWTVQVAQTDLKRRGCTKHHKTLSFETETYRNPLFHFVSFRAGLLTCKSFFHFSTGWAKKWQLSRCLVKAVLCEMSKAEWIADFLDGRSCELW